MKKVFSKLNSILNKDVTQFLNKHKILLASIGVVVLLACISLIVTYAFYQVVDTTPVIGASTSNIPDLDIRVMAEERDTNGVGVGTYDVYPYIPQAGYKYNTEKSYCTNGSTINYDADNFDADVTAQGHDVCYLYFDSIATLDITLEVYAENVNEDGEGTSEYTKLETSKLPSVGYEYNSTLSYCYYAGSEDTHVTDTYVSFDTELQNFTLHSNQRGAICKVYMDAIDVDIALKIYVQAKKGSTLYYEAESIPTTAFYALNTTKSTCTGTSALSVVNQRINIAATYRTSCVAYLDVSSGPILESMAISGGDTSSTVTLTNSNLGTTPQTYYYSSDGGETYTSSASSTATLSASAGETVFMAYSVDSSGNTSRIMETSTYSYYGLVDYSNQNQIRTISVPGYYKLEVWGASGGGTSADTVHGYGGYSQGYIYLNSNQTLYINVGGAGSAVTAAVTSIAGGYNGGGSAHSTDSSGTNNYGSGGGATHIATVSGTLNTLSESVSDLVIVAGGGGGSAYYKNGTSYYHYGSGGSGGGATGGNSFNGYTSTQTLGVAQGGGQTLITSSDSNNVNGSFGKGADGPEGYSGGGGGYYGGQTRRLNGAGGGSGYIGNTLLLNKTMYCYGCTADSTESAKTVATTCYNTQAVEACAKEGNGFAVITYVGTSLE